MLLELISKHISNSRAYSSKYLSVSFIILLDILLTLLWILDCSIFHTNQGVVLPLPFTPGD
jgi:hypothetical protein